MAQSFVSRCSLQRLFTFIVQESSLEGSSSGSAGKGEPNMGLEKVQARLVTSPCCTHLDLCGLCEATVSLQDCSSSPASSLMAYTSLQECLTTC